MKVIWSESSRDELRAIRGYLERPRTAARIIRSIRSRVRLLQRFPFSGRMVPEYGDPNLREVIVGQFRVFHRIERDRVVILHVLDGRKPVSASSVSEAVAEYGIERTV